MLAEKILKTNYRHESGRGKKYLKVSQSKGGGSGGCLGPQKLKGFKCLLLHSMRFPGIVSRGLKWLFFPSQRQFHQKLLSSMHQINQGRPPPARTFYFFPAPHAHSFAGLRYLGDQHGTWCTTCLPVKPVPLPLIFALSVQILTKVLSSFWQRMRLLGTPIFR